MDDNPVLAAVAIGREGCSSDPTNSHASYIDDRDRLMPAEATTLRSPNSGSQSTVDIAGLINKRQLRFFQKGIMVLIGGEVDMDSLEVTSNGFVATALSQVWQFYP